MPAEASLQKDNSSRMSKHVKEDTGRNGTNINLAGVVSPVQTVDKIEAGEDLSADNVAMVEKLAPLVAKKMDTGVADAPTNLRFESLAKTSKVSGIKRKEKTEQKEIDGAMRAILVDWYIP